MIQQKCSICIYEFFLLCICVEFSLSHSFLLDQCTNTFSNMLLYDNYLGKICYINQYQSIIFFYQTISTCGHSLKEI